MECIHWPDTKFCTRHVIDQRDTIFVSADHQNIIHLITIMIVPEVRCNIFCHLSSSIVSELMSALATGPVINSVYCLGNPPLQQYCVSQLIWWPAVVNIIPVHHHCRNCQFKPGHPYLAVFSTTNPFVLEMNKKVIKTNCKVVNDPNESWDCQTNVRWWWSERTITTEVMEPGDSSLSHGSLSSLSPYPVCGCEDSTVPHWNL